MIFTSKIGEFKGRFSFFDPMDPMENRHVANVPGENVGD